MVNFSFGQTFQQALDSLLEHKFPANSAGIAVLVIKNNQEIYKKGFGLANIEKKEAITPNTNFRMASVSKQFTAMCIILLEKQGKLSYEDNLLKFFPDFAPSVGTIIKIKHLLTHSSGIIDYEDLIPENQKKQILDDDVLELVKNQTTTYFEAGKQFRYSNTGFCLLEQIVEKVSGEKYSSFIEKNIFRPVGMLNTSMYSENAQIPNRAMGYTRNDKGEIAFSDQSITSATKGDGCVYTSLNDYKKWVIALQKNQLVNLETQLAKINFQLNNTSKFEYGFGWFNYLNSKNQLELYHTGSTCGFSNSVSIVPKSNYFFVFFSNIANNHGIEQPIYDLMKKYKLTDSEINFKFLLEQTR
ncbi:serine hydrolase [Emticicia aquatilis]|uniref:Serine hydrolase n=2 Tax=Emticicia aquatilis TaxID=1537369 RepID=A0A916YLH8_9BACT|nr:serine hydrolase [Emticicia aquatilis]